MVHTLLDYSGLDDRSTRLFGVMGVMDDRRIADYRH